jgi:hypothetical protein
MSMRHNGLAKLTEEAGEVMQIAGKMLQYPDTQIEVDGVRCLHPDGTHLRTALQFELGDLQAAIDFTIAKLGLDKEFVRNHRKYKLNKFREWDKEK